MEVNTMDSKKIGQFLAELRKQQNLTQEQLAEKLGVTGKTVSRWETGVYTPPADCLLQLSQLYSITINEILTGRRLEEEEYRPAAEENLEASIKRGEIDWTERLHSYRKQWIQTHIKDIVILIPVCIAVWGYGFIIGASEFCILGVFLLLFFLGLGIYSMQTSAKEKIKEERGK